MIGFHAVPLLLMGMLLTAIVLIMRATPNEKPPKPLTRKQLKRLAQREVDRYAKKHRDS
jgi:hypothetical protein